MHIAGGGMQTAIAFKERSIDQVTVLDNRTYIPSFQQVRENRRMDFNRVLSKCLR